MMALLGGTFGDGAASGTTAATLESVLGTRSSYKQIDVKAPAANVGSLYIGDSATVSPTNAFIELAAGESWGLNPQSFTSPAGSDFELDTAQVWIVGTDVADQAFVIALA